MPGFVIRFLVGTAILLAGVGRAAEPPSTPVVVIVDSSGSMAARMGGTTKLDTARAALGGMLAEWPPRSPIAIVAYGHRRAGDCADIETIVKLGPLDPAVAEARLRALKARGKTPLSDALKHAAGLLTAEQGGNIVLLSDGLETCAPDPCAVAQALHAANGRVRIFVVGFDVAAKDSEQLRCIAENGGGTFYAALDAAALSAALGTAREAVAAPAPPPAEPAALVPMPALPLPPLPAIVLPVLTVPPPQIFTVGFRAVLGEGGKLLDFPVDWTIRSADGGDFRYEANARGVQLELEEGRYIAAVAFANARGEREIELDTAPGAAIDVPVIAGEVALQVKPSHGDAPLGDTPGTVFAWTLTPLDGQGAVTPLQLAAPRLVVAPGRYAAQVTAQGVTAKADVTIAAGKTETVTLNLALGRVTLEAAVKADGDPIVSNTGIAWTIASAADPALRFETPATARPSFTLPAGAYEATLALGGATMTTPVEIADGQDETRRVVVPVTSVTFTAALAPGQPLFTDWRDTMWTVKAVDVVGLETDAALMADMPAANPAFDLLPGRYAITVVGRVGGATATAEAIVVPGPAITQRIDLNAARLTIVGSVPAQEGESADNAYFMVTRLEGAGEPEAQPLAAVQRTPFESILPPGRYHIAVESPAGRAERDVELQAGDVRTETVLPSVPP